MLKEEADVESPQKEWGQYVLYRDDIINRIDGILERKRTWRQSERGCGIVGISFATDCYMDGRAGKITREVVASLARHNRHARVLTRNPILALQDADVFQEAGEFVTIGSSIPSINTDEVFAIEPRAPSPQHRIQGLQEFNELGVNTFVSMSPTYPTMEKGDMQTLLKEISKCDPDVIFHEPINPRSGNFRMTVEAAEEAGQRELACSLDELRNHNEWFKYSVRQFRWVQTIGADLDLPIHLWPDKRQLNMAEGKVKEWLISWKERQSPEDFANRDTPSADMPPIPEELFREIF